MESQIDSFEMITDNQRESINRIDGDLQGLFTDVRGTDKRLYELETSTSKELLAIRRSIREQIEEILQIHWQDNKIWQQEAEYPEKGSK